MLTSRAGLLRGRVASLELQITKPTMSVTNRGFTKAADLLNSPTEAPSLLPARRMSVQFVLNEAPLALRTDDHGPFLAPITNPSESRLESSGASPQADVSLDYRSQSPVSLVPMCSSSPNKHLQLRRKARDAPNLSLPQEEEWRDCIRTRAQLRAILGEDTNNPPEKRRIEREELPRKRRRTVINIEPRQISDEIEVQSPPVAFSTTQNVSKLKVEPETQAKNKSQLREKAHFDSRYDRSAVTYFDGEWWVPRGCFQSASRCCIVNSSCRQLRIFCNRADPCHKCAWAGIACIREDGLVVARSFHHRRNGGHSHVKSEPTRPHHCRSVVKSAEGISFVKLEEAPSPPKPAARGEPLVWADTRQELCEGVPYFRSYQGGIYFRYEVAFGYLLDAFGAERDFIGSNVVISHGYATHLSSADRSGGRSSLDPLTNVRSLAGSQLCTDRGVSALLSNWRTETPLVLILGSKCGAAPVYSLLRELMAEFGTASILCYGLVSNISCLGQQFAELEVMSSANLILRLHF